MGRDLPRCHKCGICHPILRFEQLQHGAPSPCVREPLTLGEVMEAILERMRQREAGA